MLKIIQKYFNNSIPYEISSHKKKSKICISKNLKILYKKIKKKKKMDIEEIIKVFQLTVNPSNENDLKQAEKYIEFVKIKKNLI